MGPHFISICRWTIYRFAYSQRVLFIRFRRLAEINWTNTIVDFTPFSDEEVGPLIWATSNDFGEAKRVPVAAARVDS